MKIALICPSNKLYMPYVSNYELILSHLNMQYDIINWDRFKIEDSHDSYRDQKIGHKRNYYDYLKYKKYLLHKLTYGKYDKIIVFGIQLSYFLKKILIKKYKKNFVIDIRDYNKLKHFFNLKKLIECTQFTVISSAYFKEWLPENQNYLINHNTQVKCISNLKEIRPFNLQKIGIANIGAIRDFQINKELIQSLSNNDRFELFFHGEGNINENIQTFVEVNKINNVFITGRYLKDAEEQLFDDCDLVNILRFNDGINNNTALPNRIYNSALYGKPMLAYEGTYLANEISKYNLGIVLSSFSNVGQNIINYLAQFNEEEFQEGRKHFISKTIEENAIFNENLIKFLNS